MLSEILIIVCINCLNPFSNEEILTLGMLREPLSTSLQRATHILFYNSDLVEPNILSEIIQKVKYYIITAENDDDDENIKKLPLILYGNMKPKLFLKLKKEYKNNNYKGLKK